MTQAVFKNQVTELNIASGIDQKARERIAVGLAESLADSYRLMANTQILHWNVQGPLFYSMHNLTEAQYQDFFASVDVLAERIRALGMPAPRSMSQLIDATSFKDIDGYGNLMQQISALVEQNEKAASRMRALIRVAEEAGDVKTADLLTDRIGVLEQNSWMLRATIADSE